MSHTHTVEDGFPNLEQMEEINQPLSKPTLSSSGFADSSAPVVRREVSFIKIQSIALTIAGDRSAPCIE